MPAEAPSLRPAAILVVSRPALLHAIVSRPIAARRSQGCSPWVWLVNASFAAALNVAPRLDRGKVRQLPGFIADVRGGRWVRGAGHPDCHQSARKRLP
jgi:hypothetical protein